jgi:formate-dependent nitrite reductase cytochrome c552 subunit
VGISGTDFHFEDPRMIPWALSSVRQRPRTATIVEVAELLAECGEDTAGCISCEDGVVAFDLRPNGEDLELFLRLGVAFRHGAWERQGPALLKIAADMGASTIAFESRRRGWYRRLGPEWHRRGTLELVREVT